MILNCFIDFKWRRKVTLRSSYQESKCGDLDSGKRNLLGRKKKALKNKQKQVRAL